ncbi:unnamed protein product [Thlaspi arvense]|uniref:Cathepsin propeptide inhibitor domain-containing protein n=1 Tax=Thlaspi arvense TaxID=13288 RepID=A0AAU9SAX7_THLAR|nr:unnamed protein product [Thlaspi arvense]
MASIMVLVTVLTILFTTFRISQATSRTVTFHEPSMVNKHEQWMARFSRVYRDELEKQMRRDVFKKNLKFIEEFNKKENKSYKVGVNEFADWTSEEFLATHTGLKNLTNIPPSTVVGKMMPSKSWDVSNVAAESKDWRSEGAVTPVKYQGQCARITRLRSLAMERTRTGLSTGWLRTLGVKLGEKMVTLGYVETWLGLKACVV